MNRYSRLAVLAGIAALALTMTASPALAIPAARALAPASQLYVVDCTHADLFSVDPSNAVATQIGTSTNSLGSCGKQPAWDATTNTAYFFGLGSGTTLTSVNLATGAQVNHAAFSGGSNPPASMAIDPVTGRGYVYQVGGRFYGLDVPTSALSLIATVAGNPTVTAMAFQPNTGVLYAITTAGVVSTVNTTTGVFTNVGSLGIANSEVESLQIDSNGVFWVVVYIISPSATQLWSFNPLNFAGSGISSGSLTHNGARLDPAALLLVPSEEPVTAAFSRATVSAAELTTPGRGVGLVFSGFLPGESVHVGYGTGASGDDVGDYVADSNGLVTVQWVPAANADFAVGTVISFGAEGATSGATAGPITGFTIVAAAATAGVAPAALPDTGANAAPILTIGGILLLAGAAFGAFSLIRRRRSQV